MDLFLLQSLELHYVVLPALGIVALIGLLAVVSPRHFAAVSRFSSQWIDTRRLWDVLDRRIDVDHPALQYSRVFGAAVVAAALLLLWVYWTQILGMPLPRPWA